MKIKNQVWAKTRFFTKDNRLHSVTCLVVNGNPRVLRFSIPLETLNKYATQYHDYLHEQKGDEPSIGATTPFKQIAKLGRKIGRSKLLRKIHKTSKKIIKSDITKGVFVAGAYIYPPVGIPALAAYSVANATVSAVEKGKRTSRGIKKQVKRYGKGLKFIKAIKRKVRKTVRGKRGGFRMSARAKVKFARMSPAAKRRFIARLLKKRIARSPVARRRIRKTIRGARRAKGLLKAAKAPRMRKRIRKTLKRRRKALSKIAKLRIQAKYGSPKTRLNARKMLAVIRIAAKARRAKRDISKGHLGGTTGLLIDAQGTIRPGTYARQGGTQAVLYTPKKISRGRYSLV